MGAFYFEERRNDMATKKANIIPTKRQTTNTATIATMFGLSSRRINQLVDEGIINKISPGCFDLVETVKLYITHLQTQKDAKNIEGSNEALKIKEDMLLKKARREKEELKLKLMKNELHKSSDVERMVTGMIMNAKSKLEAIPSKLAPKLINVKDQGYIFDVIQEEIAAVENELADYNPKDYASEVSTEDDS